MNKTLKVAEDRAYDDSKTVLPVEIARGTYIEHPPSAQALKLLHLMIARAAGAMAEDRHHELKASDFRAIKGMRKHDKASLMPLFTQLRAATFHYDDVEAKELHIGGFLDHAKIDYRYEDETGEITVRWWFGGLFKKLAADSNHWAIIDRQTVFNLRSKYSILLFQHISSLVNLDHKVSQIFTIKELRGMLGVPEGKLRTWNEMNRFALKPAVAEVNQLARFTVKATPIKDGRHVDAVRISWEVKSDIKPVKAELDRPKAGRKARREGAAETPVNPFPATGGIRYSQPWGEIAKQHGNGKDINLIANDFRKWCKSKGIPLDGANIAKQFESFSKRAKI